MLLKGWVLCLLTLLIPVIRFPYRISLIMTLWFVIAAHEAVAYVNAYWLTLKGAGSDAVSFHNRASWFLSHSIEKLNASHWWELSGSQFYAYILSFLYNIVASHPFIGAQLSIVALVLSCVLLINLTNLIQPSAIIGGQYVPQMLLLFGMLPSGLIFMSTTLREPLQILLFISTVYFFLLFHQKSHISHLMISLSALFGLGMMHKGLYYYAPLLLSIFLIWYMLMKLQLTKRRVVQLGGIVVCTGLVVVLCTSLYFRFVDIVHFINHYGQGNPGRTEYVHVINLETPWQFVWTTLIMYSNYLFAPLLGQHIANALDLYALIEAAFRLILFVCALRAYHYLQPHGQRIWWLLIMIYLSVSFLFAMGNHTFGNAIRHHLVHYWIIVLLGTPYLVIKVKEYYHRLSNQLIIRTE